MRAFDYAIADKTQGAVAALEKGYHIKAGGIDLLDLMKERIDKSDRFVSITNIKELRGITEKDGGISIGALTTLREIAESELLRKKHPALVNSVEHAATPQIRAVATAAGNILQRPRCWYFRQVDYHCLKKGGATCYALEGDNTYHAIFGKGPCHITHASNLAPALVAARAQIVVTDGKSAKKYEATEFFTMPNDDVTKENKLSDKEIVTEIFLPKPPEKSGYVEVKEKQSFDWPLAACIATYTDKKWSIILSHVAPVPWRAELAENMVAGNDDISEQLAESAADAAVKDANPMTQNGFRVHLARAVVRRALLKACGKEFV